MMNKKTYFITGGGTGGHIYPALAVANKLNELENTEKIYYIGNPEKLEGELLKDLPYIFLPVKSSGMPRKIGLQLILWLFQLLFATLRCCYLIIKYRPNIIFGTGGYVSAPAIIASILLKVPFVMHDCDANPGLVTRKFAKYAKGVSVAFENAITKINTKNCHVNGNPISGEFIQYNRKTAREKLNLQDKLTLCVMGGSQGAKSINQAFVPIIKELSKKYDLQIIFQCGKKNYEDTKNKLLKEYPEFEKDNNIIFKPYFNDLKLYLIASDIAVSRAGSLSISELAASSVATIFVPYPHAAQNHQRKNAKCLVEQNAGIYIDDNEISTEILYKSIVELITNNQKLKEFQSNINKLAKLQGVENIVKLLLENAK